MATNTTKSLNQATTNTELDAQIKKAKAAFDSEKQVKVKIPEVLKSSIGQTLLVGVNGVFVNIPVDGKEYPLPETFAKHVDQMLADLK